MKVVCIRPCNGSSELRYAPHVLIVHGTQRNTAAVLFQSLLHLAAAQPVFRQLPAPIEPSGLLTDLAHTYKHDTVGAGSAVPKQVAAAAASQYEQHEHLTAAGSRIIAHLLPHGWSCTHAVVSCCVVECLKVGIKPEDRPTWIFATASVPQAGRCHSPCSHRPPT